MPFAATWIDLEISILSEVKQIKKNIFYDLHLASNKNDTKELLFTKQKQTSRFQNQNYGYQRGN